MRTIRFHHVDNDAIMAYSKFDPVTGDTVLTVVTLNPFSGEEGHRIGWTWEISARHGVRRVLGPRRGHRGGIPMGTLQLRSPGAGAGRRAHILNMPPIPSEQRAALLRRE